MNISTVNVNAILAGRAKSAVYVMTSAKYLTAMVTAIALTANAIVCADTKGNSAPMVR